MRVRIRLPKINWSSPRTLLSLTFLALALVYPLVVRDIYLRHVAIEVLLWACLAQSWNIIGGYGGQLSLGHAAFFGLGAYTSTLLHFEGVSPWIGMFIGGFVAMASCLIISYPTFRLRGPFFALASIAFVELLRIIFLSFRDFTGGAVGLTQPYHGVQGDPLFMQFSIKLGKLPWFYIILGMFLVIELIVYKSERSKLGYSLVAIREDQEAAESLGVHSLRSKMKAMLISAFLTGVLGTFYANYFYFIDPDTVFNINISIEMAVVAIIGGVSSLWGPLIGAMFLVPVDLYTNVWLGGTYAGVHLIVYGVIIMFVVRFFPFGFIGYVKSGYDKLVSLLEKR